MELEGLEGGRTGTSVIAVETDEEIWHCWGGHCTCVGNIDQSNGSGDGFVDRVNRKSSSSIESSDREESEFVDGEDICVADEDIHTEGEIISLSSPTAVTAESGMTTTPLEGEAGLLRKYIDE
jgi:hypothetical protein